jgi:regulator of protease activity HflC (stomatin/prohibitin superfamily)
MKRMMFFLAFALLMQSCAVVRQGEVGVKQRFGKFSSKALNPGLTVINPFVTRVVRMPLQTVNREVLLDLPSKEGLTVRSEISILYHIEKSKAMSVLENIGLDYEESVVVSVFRSASADVCSRFFAKDMHSVQRAVIEKDIAESMNKILQPRGFEVEAVLLKSIKLPDGLSRAIEAKLESEQRSQQMQFELQRERQEAERRIIEATGKRDAQKILSEGLTKEILQLRHIEALQQLSTSSNAKIIIGNGQQQPFLLDTK